MNGSKIFADTNILLYFLNGEEDVIEILSNKEIFISFVSELEMLSYPNISPDSEKIINDFLSQCSIININNEIKQATISLRKKYNLKLPDSIIAASASVLNFPILTADQQFRKIKSLEIILYEPN